MLPFLAGIAPFAPLIGGLLGGLGALFAPKPEPVVNTTTTDIRAMRDEAERAGFNPVSVLRAGGLQGFQRTTQTGGVSFNPVGDFLGHVGTGLMNFNWDGGLGAARTMAEIGLMKAQTKSFSTPMTSTMGGSTQRVTKQAAGAWDWMKPGVTTKAEGVKSVIDPSGNPFFILPGTDAQTVEDELGEGAGNIHGMERWFKSWMWNNFGGRETTHKGVKTKQYTGGGF